MRRSTILFTLGGAVALAGAQTKLAPNPAGSPALLLAIENGDANGD